MKKSKIIQIATDNYTPELFRELKQYNTNKELKKPVKKQINRIKDMLYKMGLGNDI